MPSARTTTSHEDIRKRIGKRGGHPAVVAATENRSGQGSGLLRVDYDDPGSNDDNRLYRMTWHQFFKILDENEFSFLYDPEEGSRFREFVENVSARS